MKNTAMTREEKMEELLTAYCGGLDADEMAELQMMRIARAQVHREKAVSTAKRMLRQAKHPVNRKDMLDTMDAFIALCVDNFEQMMSKESAIMLLSAVICKNILTDGPLHEEE